MDNTDVIAVIGLGLIGSSIARSIKNKIGTAYIIGIDKNADYIRAALEDGVISSGHVMDNFDVHILSTADIVFICTPLRIIETIVSNIIPYLKAGCIITDTASVKSPIIQAIKPLINEKISFIGGHPMAGTEQSGYYAGNSHMLENAYYVLTPIDSTSGALNKLSSIITAIGAKPIVMDAEMHDNVVAAISHMPHVLASTLLQYISKHPHAEYMKMLAAGAFRDMTRIASSDPQMWRDICLANANAVKQSLNGLIDVLMQFNEILDKKDEIAITRYFATAKECRESISAFKPSYSQSTFDIIADVEDRPGIIGEIASLIGQHGLNIKNIAILNSREGLPGALKISFQDESTSKKALEILRNTGFKVYTD